MLLPLLLLSLLLGAPSGVRGSAPPAAVAGGGGEGGEGGEGNLLHCTAASPAALASVRGRGSGSSSSSSSSSPGSRVQVVVSHFNEDLGWLLTALPATHYDVLVYTKGRANFSGTPVAERLLGRVRALPNVGREGHTILSHVLARWDDLPEVTLFLPGNAGVHPWRVGALAQMLGGGAQARLLGGGACCKGARANASAAALEGSAAVLGTRYQRWTCTDAANAARNGDPTVLPSRWRPLSAWVERHLGAGALAWLQAQPTMRACFNGVVGVHRDRLRRWPRSTYAGIVAELASHHNPEAGFFLEYLWLALWGDPDLSGVSDAAGEEFE